MQLEHTLPLLNRINPVTMVTDAMYALALNGGSGRVMRDIFWMLLMAALFFTAGVLLQRRKQFKSLRCSIPLKSKGCNRQCFESDI